MNFPYVPLRLIRHYMPASTAQWLLRMNLIIHPGLETSDYKSAIDQYTRALDAFNYPLKDKRCMVFGHGGRFSVGCGLLERGASHVVLCDKFAHPDDHYNNTLVPTYDQYLQSDGSHVLPNPEFITLLHDDIRQSVSSSKIPKVDVVLSNSVYEHLDDVEGITGALAKITHPKGIHLHFIDLRDHFFRYPFEMLTFKKSTWTRWLNPTSNLNRYRLRDYQRAFETYFKEVKITVLERDLSTFQDIKTRIRPEFLIGDTEIDAVTRIQVLASEPLKESFQN